MTAKSLFGPRLENGAEYQNAIRTAATELASVQAGMGIPSLFRPCWTDCESGGNGCRNLIARILIENGAVIDGTAKNVHQGMTTEAIISAARAINGYDKYPDRTFEQNLSVVMTESGQAIGIQMSNEEDADRNSDASKEGRISRRKNAIAKKPRKSWFLLLE